MAFDTFNEQAAAKTGRYLTARPAVSGLTFTQADQQQIRWQFPGLLIAESQEIPFGRLGGELKRHATYGGTLTRG